MQTTKVNIPKLLPVLMGFFVMSFCDLVGVAVDYASKDFALSPSKGQLITSAVFLWFLLFSVPTGILQARIGKRNMLNIGMGITAVGMLVPFFIYSFATVLFGFALLGIGNTIVQVSANPLLIDVVPGNRVSSFLSFSQFVKSVGSMVAAPLAGYLAARYGDWKILFLVFGVVSVLAVVWLGATRIGERQPEEGVRVTFGSAFRLLGNGFIVLMVLAIFVVVGIDVGFNSNSGQFLHKYLNMDEELSTYGRTVYFLGRMVGMFGGALLLTRLSSRTFLLWTSILGLIALIGILTGPVQWLAWGIVFIIGLAVANIFPLVFSIAVERHPNRTNEISGLMMMAIVGGAVIPLVMGWMSEVSGVAAGMWVLVICMIYLIGVAFYCLRKA